MIYFETIVTFVRFLVFLLIGPAIVGVIAAAIAAASFHSTKSATSRKLSEAKRHPFAHFFVSAFLNALFASVTVIAATLGSLWWRCYKHGQGCHDGQGGIVLIFLVPSALVLGAMGGFVFSWILLDRPPTQPLVTARLYRGVHRIWNRVLIIGMPVLVWALIGFFLFAIM